MYFIIHHIKHWILFGVANASWGGKEKDYHCRKIHRDSGSNVGKSLIDCSSQMILVPVSLGCLPVSR